MIVTILDKVVFGDTFFVKGWQNQLCRCENCMKMYTDLQLLWMFQLPNDIETTSEGSDQF